MRARLGVLALVISLAACSGGTGDRGFAGLAERAGQQSQVPFLQPGPDTALHFPDDFGPHPQYRVEWWYLTANLTTTDGQPLGLQWTQFRQAIEARREEASPPPASEWPLESAWMAHGAVSWDGRHYFSEKLARGAIGHAGAAAAPFEVWLDDWHLAAQPDARVWHLQAGAGDWSYDLRLTIQGEPVAHGQGGFSAKSASGEGSMYFSLVDIAIEGSVTLEGERLAVTGKGWFDREWSSQFLKTGQQGWDWFALHLDSGDKLMAFRLREEGGEFRAGTWIPDEGQPVALTEDDLRMTAQAPEAGTPTRWRIRVPAQGLDLRLESPPGSYRNTGLYSYWESPVRVSGSDSGVGYMELTGYESP